MAQLTYLDFDLLIDRVGKKYKGRVINSPAGQAATEFDVPFSAGELQEFWSKFESCLQKKDGSPADCKATLKKFGGQLFAAVFADQVRSSFSASLNEASREGTGLRLRLRLTEAPELAALPWEFLHDPAINRFLSLSNQTPIVRYLDLPERIKPLNVQPPLRILVMVSSPWDLPQLEVEQEWENVKSALAEAERNGLVQLERLETATLPALQKRLREKPFHFFHFIGHGDFDEPAQAGVLYLENEDKMKRAVSGDELGILLHDEETLRVAVLNACRGSRSTGRDPFSGLAQRLVQQGVPAVIAMQAPISDTAALIFSQEFYSALAFGYPVDAAVSEARKAIFSQVNELEWGTPVLFMRSPDGRIFDMASVSGKEGADLKTKDVNRKEDESGKGRVGKKLSLWLGIIVAAITILTTILGLPKLWQENVAPPAARFFGKVHYAGTDEPVPGATIRVQASEKADEALGFDETDAKGWFNFVVKAASESPVWVVVSKDGHNGYAGTQVLAGNAKIPFRRKP